MTTYTSRSRFDESRRFTGVYQQMGRVMLDADWNEEVRIRTTDAARRSAVIADGAPSDAFLISSRLMFDPVVSTEGWSGVEGDPSLLGTITPSITLARSEPSSLPYVIRARGYTEVRRTLPNGRRLNRSAATAPSIALPPFALARLYLTVRFEIPAGTVFGTPSLVITGESGEATFSMSSLGVTMPPTDGATVVLSVAGNATALGTIGLIKGWGLVGLAPQVTVSIAGLTVERTSTSPTDEQSVAIRGGDGTLAGAGVMFVDGIRAHLTGDIEYLRQPDYPLPPLPQSMAGSRTPPFTFLAYLDLWELPVTTELDPFLAEPALDGNDTTTRLRLVQQIKFAVFDDGAPLTLPSPTGGGTLTTSFAGDDSRPLRYPVEPVDACRDRCLHTESIATGTGYRGTENIHVRVQVLDAGGRRAALWSRDNGSTMALLTEDAPTGATRVSVSPEAAARFSAGDLVVVEDRITRLQPEGGAIDGDVTTLHAPVLRRIRAVDAATGAVELEATGATVGLGSDPLPVGGALPHAFRRDDKAAIRRWEGADWIVAGQRYNLSDGIELAFSGTHSIYRPGDFWSFTARVHDPDGEAVGKVEALVDAPPHGPVHHYGKLATLGVTDTHPILTDLRKRFLPLADVRDRLVELEQQAKRLGPFTVVVGDGTTSFGDVNQDASLGITGDDAIQAAILRLGAQGGTVYIRGGVYTLARPVLVEGLSRVLIAGDGASTELRASGPGGVFIVDRCGQEGFVRIEALMLNDVSSTSGGGPGGPADEPPPAANPITDADLLVPGGGPSILEQLATTISGTSPPRAMDAILAAHKRLRWIQKNAATLDPSVVDEGEDLLAVLRQLPRGAVTVSDSQLVRIRDCALVSQDASPLSKGVFLTGTCQFVEVAKCVLQATEGLTASPLASHFTDAFLSLHPGAGLSLSDVLIQENIIVKGDGSFGVYGIHLADGDLAAMTIRDNRVEEFAIGVALADHVELHPLESNIATEPWGPHLIAGNRIGNSKVIGIQVAADGVDVAENDVSNAPSSNLLTTSGLVQAGIQITGQRVRVRDCWLGVNALSQAPQLGVAGAIVIGDGMDDGASPARPVFDVEITGNHVEGHGTAAAAAGVLIGGPQPIYDVRIRGNVIRNLGDAAVRVLGTGIAAGRIRVEDNRIEQVCLANVPVQDSTAPTQINLLVSGLASALLTATPTPDLSKPKDILTAALAQPATTAAPVIDAVLRWIERITLRGAVVLNRVEGADVIGNSIFGVGHYSDTPPPSFPAEVRVAGVAAVGGSDLVVEGNHVEDVRAAVALTDTEDPSELPPVYAAIEALQALADGSTEPIARATLHDAAVELHAMLLALASLGVEDDDERAEICGRLFGAIDAVAEQLALARMSSVAESLAAVGAVMRGVQEEAAPLTEAADAARVFVAHAIKLTAENDPSTIAWDAVLRVEGGLAAGEAFDHIADAIRAMDRLLDDVPFGLKGEVLAALTALDPPSPPPAPTIATVRAAIGTVAKLGLLQDALARTGRLEGTEAFGHRRDIIVSLARTVDAQITALAGAPTTTIVEMRRSVRGLSQMLREVGSELAAHVETDFIAVDRRTPVTSGPILTQLDDTIARVIGWAAGDPAAQPSVDDSAAQAAIRLAQTRARYALIQVTIEHVDGQIGRLSDLAAVSEALYDEVLYVIQSDLDQLAGLVEDDPDLSVLAAGAVAELTAAVAADVSDRGVRMERLRDALREMLRLARELVSASAGASASGAPTERTERRLAALGALLLTLRELTPGGADPWPTAMDLFTTHMIRALEEAGAGATAITAARDALAHARTSILGSGTPSATVWSDIATLADTLDGAASSVAGKLDTPPMTAAATLVHTALLALGTAGDDSDRMVRALRYLGGRRAEVSGSIVDRILAQPTLDKVRGALRDALERIALGEVSSLREAEALDHPLPEPADGVFAAAVKARVSVARNTILSALLGVALLGDAGHVLADPGTPSELLLEVIGNRLRGCAVGALEIIPRAGAGVTVMVADNHAIACADLPASGAALGWGGAASAVQVPASHAVARFAGSGDLLVHGNVFQGNGHGKPRALLHEILVDWRGDVVLRGNTVRHTGGGAGGAALLVLTEALGTGAAALLAKLAISPALAVEPPPAKPTSRRVATRAPWRALGQATSLTIPAVTTARYVTQAAKTPITGVKDFLTVTPAPLQSLRLVAPVQRSSVHVEGNHVQATGPALLVLGAPDGAIVTATVVGNELRSFGQTGAVYLRHTDATILNGNECESLSSINVVVVRPHDAPVSISGNVVLGAQPVAQVNPSLLAARADLKRVVRVAAASPRSTIATTTPTLQGLGLRLMSLREAGHPVLLWAPGVLEDPPYAVRLTGVNQLLLNELLAPKKTVPPAEPPPKNPRMSSLVVVGGTRVVAVGNATTAGAHVIDADELTELNA